MTEVPPVECEVWIDAPPQTVFRMLTEADLLTLWLGVSATLEPAPGGTFRFELFEGEFCSGTYLEVVPDERVVFTWGWESGAMPPPPGTSTVRIDLEPRRGGTLLRLVHEGLDEIAGTFHADGWPKFLERLDAAAAGGELPPDPAACYAAGKLLEERP